MSSILEEFAYGNLPVEIPGLHKSQEYGRTLELVADIQQNLFNRLQADDKTLFERYVDAQSEAIQLTAVKNLVYGYKLGLIMTAEAFVGMDDLF